MLASHSVSPVAELKVGDTTAEHYVVEGFLGVGGMGQVYRVRHAVTGAVVALKRLRKEHVEAKPVLAMLFEREYHTLRQLAHPNIVEVYDYGHDDDGPYYTMELLDGEDLHALAPLPFRDACRLLRDVASSLALIHSRRLLHRDVSPRNVRIGHEGRAKLIDFGALATIGVAGELIGTPPCIPPEVVHGQPLDNRADLYALGALAYWTLTGQHAYAASTAQGLRDAWRSRPRLPSTLQSDIPKAMDQLVMSLLSLDPLARPVSAGEVIERLTSLAELEPLDTAKVAQAYLRTPTLVGRHDQRLRFRKQVLRAGRGRGSVLLLEAAPGLGRTRMLHALELEGKLNNATVLGVDCGAVEGELGTLRALVRELLRILPEQTVVAAREHASLLGRAIEELRPHLGSEVRDHAPLGDDEAAALDGVLRDWLLALCSSRTLVIALDDAHLADVSSMSVFAQLAARAARTRLALVFSFATGEEPRAMAALSLIRQHAAVLGLSPLTQAEVQELAGSLFGDVPHVGFIGQWLAQVSEGSPRTCMELAQHLVEREVVRYESGAWLLPDSLRDRGLPGSLAEALDARLDALSPQTVALLYGLASGSRRIGLDEYAALIGEQVSVADVSRAIDEAVGAGVLLAHEETYAFAHHGLREAARRVGEARGLRVESQRRLARLFAARGDQSSQAAHLFAAGDEDEAVEAQLQHLGGFERYFSLDLGRSVGRGIGLQGVDDTTESLRRNERLLSACERLGRSQRDRFVMRASITAMAFHYDLSMMRPHIEPQLELLAAGCGEIYWDDFLDVFDPKERARRCFAKAHAVHAATPEDERVFTPEGALGLVILGIAHAQHLGLESHEEGAFDTAMRLAEYIRHLHPRAEAAYKSALQSQETVAGRLEHAAALRADLLEHYGSGIRETGHPLMHYGRGFQAKAEGLYRAQFGGRAAERWADELDAMTVGGEHMWKRRAWAVRRLMALYNGDAAEATRCRHELDQLSTRYAYTPYGAGSAFLEAQACAMCGDLPGLKQLIDVIAEIVRRQYPGWRPFLDTARSDYTRLRGDPGAALAHAQAALSAVMAGEHSAWAAAAVSRIEALIDLERVDEAAACAEEALAACTRADLGLLSQLALTRALASAETACGAWERAGQRLDKAIEQAIEAEVGGIPLAVLYEARARSAIQARDQQQFERFAGLAANLYRAGRNPALVAKYERLMHEARLAKLQLGAQITHAAEVASALGLLGDDLGHTQFENMGVEERRQQALTLLLEGAGTSEGFLYAIADDGSLRLLASRSDAGPPEGLETSLSAYVQAELEDTLDVTHTCFDDGLAELSTTRREVAAFRPVLLSESKDGRQIARGIAALRFSANYVHPEWDLVSTISRVLSDERAVQNTVSIYG